MSEVLIDRRAGSGDLARYLEGWGVPCSVTTLPFGDAAVEGTSPPLPADRLAVGVEVKKIRDALCCMRDGRFAGHQLPGMMREYGAMWLVVEGGFGVDNATGVMTIATKRGLRAPLRLGKNGPGFLYKEFDHWLTTMEMKAGIHVRRTTSRTETARFIADLASWWEKPWERHKSHLSFHKIEPDRAALLTPMSMVRKVAAALPGVGWSRSGLVAARFKTVEQMVQAEERDWIGLDGFGAVMAKRIWDALHST